MKCNNSEFSHLSLRMFDGLCLFEGFTVTSTGRKLKLGPISLGDFGNDISDLTSRVLQSEECVQRLVCELGSYAADVPYKSLILP